MDVKYLDTYALVEIRLGNQKFSNYEEFIINDITLAEFFGVLLKEYGEAEAYKWYRKLEGYAQPVPKEVLIEAVKFRQQHKKTGISFTDAVGYIFALKKGVVFVTGDKEFEHFPNVEFKKK